MNKSRIKSGRPKKDPETRRDNPIMLWMTPPEKQAFEKLYKKVRSQLTFSAFVLNLAKTEMKRRGVGVNSNPAG